MFGTITSIKTVMDTFAGVLEKYQNVKDGAEPALTNAEAAMISMDGSITRLLAAFTITPTFVVSKNLQGEDVIEKLIETNIDIFSSYYIQAFNVITSLYGFTPMFAFNMLSSKGAVGSKSGYQKNFFSMEDGESLAIELEFLPIGSDVFEHVGLEADPRMMGNYNSTSKVESKNSSTIGFKDDKTSISTIVNRALEIKITVSRSVEKDGNKNNREYETIIPVNIKANIVYTDFKNISNMVDTKGVDKSMSYRWHEWRSGGITFKDFIFATDLVEKYRDNKFKDKDDLLGYINNRQWSANTKVLTSKAIGFNKFYGVVIVTKNELAVLESLIGGEIKRGKYRDELMNTTASMIINVLDMDREHVVIYTKDIQGQSVASFNAIKKRKGDKDSSELVEVFKAISNNRPPVL